MTKPFATKLNEETLLKLDSLAHKTRIPKSRLCEQAIDLLVDHYKQIDDDLSLAQKIREAKQFETAKV
ncbi:MAG: ribbon-helix-helix domain-containing protein [Candidatus Omnitrophica bacterium]|nr:ribbon-helix-helix domain-containing protein [Candidatus Omnitrophota bacterium]